MLRCDGENAEEFIIEPANVLYSCSSEYGL